METIVDALCINMVSDKEQLRDISSIGLKTVISELPLGSSALVANVCKRITGRLSSAIEKVINIFKLITYLKLSIKLYIQRIILYIHQDKKKRIILYYTAGGCICTT